MVLVSNVLGILVLLSLFGLCGVSVFRRWRAARRLPWRVAGRLPFGRWVFHNFWIDVSVAFWVVLVVVFVFGLSVFLVGMMQDFGGLVAVGPGWPY